MEKIRDAVVINPFKHKRISSIRQTVKSYDVHGDCTVLLQERLQTMLSNVHERKRQLTAKK